MLTIQKSEQQSLACTWMLNGNGNAIVEAKAGSGKTTLIRMLISELRAKYGDSISILYLVFGKKNQVEADQKFGDLAEVKTFNAAGNQAWKFANKGKTITLDNWKKRNLVEEQLSIPAHLAGFVDSLVALAKGQGLGLLKPLNEASMEEIVDHFSLETEISADSLNAETTLYDAINDGIKLALKAYKLHCELATEIIDFNDQLSMPLLGKCRLKKYDYVFVDEGQDANPIKRALAKAFLAVGGRAVIVGDRRQAIMGFSGADNLSMDLYKTEFNAKELALSTCFRCSKSVVRHAQQWDSDIQFADNAPEGSVTEISQGDFLSLLNTLIPGHSAILCRYNKYLVPILFKLISAGVTARIEGKDIGTQLVKLVYRWKRVKTISALIDKLQSWKDEQVQKLISQGKEAKADSISDQVECLLVIADSLSPSASLKDLQTKIQSIFVDSDGNSKPAVVLSSIHKAKGLEWDQVFWLGRKKLQPSKYARQDWQVEQEINLMYVACTRAKLDLIEVNI